MEAEVTGVVRGSAAGSPRGAPRRARTIINEVQDEGDSLVRLRPVDRAEVTIVMDNFVDLLLAPAE
ncbi:MAG: hypothetical protein ACJ77L_07005, partial [Solirubrobacteraceae bacterium]